MYMAHERRAHILRLLAEHGSIRSAELAAELGVTDETIRTDLVRLEREGQLRRHHGGAEFLPPPATAPANASRLDHQLASALLPHIAPGSRVLVDASRLTHTLLHVLATRPLTLITHSPDLLQRFAAKSLPFHFLCVGGELEKSSCRLCPEPGALAKLAPTLAILSPERVELRGREVAISYSNQADMLWAQEALAGPAPAKLLLAVASSALAPWSGHALPCSPQVIVTEDNLPADASPPHLHLLPYLDPASLQPGDTFDY